MDESLTRNVFFLAFAAKSKRANTGVSEENRLPVQICLRNDPVRFREQVCDLFIFDLD